VRERIVDLYSCTHRLMKSQLQEIRCVAEGQSNCYWHGGWNAEKRGIVSFGRAVSGAQSLWMEFFRTTTS